MTAVTWDPNHKSSFMNLANGNRDALDVANNLYAGVRATIPRDDTRVMVEFEVIAERSIDDMYVGLCDATLFNINNASFGGFQGQGIFHVVWRGGGNVFVNGSFLATVSSYVTNDVLDIAYDPSNGKFWLRKNGAAWIGGGNPATGTTPTGTWTPLNQTYACHITDNAPSNTYNMRLHADAPQLIYALPSGYVPYGDPGSVIVQPQMHISM